MPEIFGAGGREAWSPPGDIAALMPRPAHGDRHAGAADRDALRCARGCAIPSASTAMADGVLDAYRDAYTRTRKLSLP